MALATIDDLAALLQREIAEDDVSALNALETASAVVEAYLSQTVELVSNDEIILDGTGTKVLLLPNYPVSAVASVEVDEEALVEGEEFEWSHTGELRRLNGVWPTSLRSITVTYSHGYETIPQAIVGVVTAVAGRLLNSSSIGIRQESIGGYSVTYADNSGGATLQPVEIIVLDNFRK